MAILYNIGLCLFYGIMCIAAVFNAKARKWLKGRNGLLKTLKKIFTKTDKVMWMHCSSVGEFEQGRPLLEEFRRQYPDYKILLTFFSPSGYELRKDYDVADHVSYLPLDTWTNARRFTAIVRPKIVFFIKYDYWYHHLHQAKKQGAKLYLVSGIFRPKQAFFKWYGGFFRSMLRTFTRFFVQNQESEQLLQSIRLNNVTITGDTRFDRVCQVAAQSKSYPVIEQFIDSKPVLMAGSTWLSDEEIIAQATQGLQDIKLIIVPHEIDDAHLADIEKRFAHLPVLRYTQAGDKNLSEYKIMVVDTVGMLSSLYRYAQVAYIGGGFIDGIHNTLEAAVFGVPVCFGTNYERFIEAKDLLRLGGAVSVNNATELQALLQLWFSNTAEQQKAGNICKDYVWQNQGATKKILEYLTK